jgi:hypothetical protein
MIGWSPLSLISYTGQTKPRRSRWGAWLLAMESRKSHPESHMLVDNTRASARVQACRSITQEFSIYGRLILQHWDAIINTARDNLGFDIGSLIMRWSPHESTRGFKIPDCNDSVSYQVAHIYIYILWPAICLCLFCPKTYWIWPSYSVLLIVHT